MAMQASRLCEPLPADSGKVLPGGKAIPNTACHEYAIWQPEEEYERFEEECERFVQLMEDGKRSEQMRWLRKGRQAIMEATKLGFEKLAEQFCHERCQRKAFLLWVGAVRAPNIDRQGALGSCLSRIFHAWNRMIRGELTKQQITIQNLQHELRRMKVQRDLCGAAMIIGTMCMLGNTICKRVAGQSRAPINDTKQLKAAMLKLEKAINTKDAKQLKARSQDKKQLEQIIHENTRQLEQTIFENKRQLEEAIKNIDAQQSRARTQDLTHLRSCINDRIVSPLTGRRAVSTAIGRGWWFELHPSKL